MFAMLVIVMKLVVSVMIEMLVVTGDNTDVNGVVGKMDVDCICDDIETHSVSDGSNVYRVGDDGYFNGDG